VREDNVLRVDIYRNLRDNCLSVKSLEQPNYGKVINHVDKIFIDSPSFVIQSSGLKKAKKNNVRNVHAFVRGERLDDQPKFNKENATKVIYNPFEFESFVTAIDHRPVSKADKALVVPSCVHAINVK
jgi:hypothetical protein